MKKLLRKIDFSYVYSFLGEATLGFSFVLYIILGRFLGPEQYGVFTSANALAGILTLFILFGFAGLLSREVAANPEEGPKFTTNFLLIEAFNCLLVLLFLFPLTKGLGFEGNSIIVCYLVVVAGGFRCTKLTLRSVLTGLGKFKTEAIAVTIERTALFLCAGTALFLTKSLVWVVGIMALVRLIDFIGLYFFLKRKVPVTAPISLGSFRKSFKLAYPFAISGVLWVLYYQVDMVMLKVLSPSQEVGFYGAAYGLIEIFSALPRVIFYVVFPRLTRCYATDPGQLPERIRQAALLLLAVGLPFITLAGFAQTFLVKMTYGQAFLPAISALALLLPSLSVKMFASLSSNILQAIRREKLVPTVLLTTVCINVISNLILIPRLGATGAALATLISEVIFSIVGLSIVTRVGYKSIGQKLLLVALISLLVAAIPSLLIYGLNPAIAIALLALSLTAIALLMYRPAAIA